MADKQHSHPTKADDTSSTNLNKSASPTGDGVQSSASEKQAAGQDGPSQGSQQRINAAERRETRAATQEGDHKPDGPVNAVQSPGEVLPSPGGVDLADVAAANAKEAESVEQRLKEGDLPQATLDEINAGKKALEGGRARRDAELGKPTTAPTNPVDATERAQQARKADEK